jgi:hypothetical protein
MKNLWRQEREIHMKCTRGPLYFLVPYLSSSVSTESHIVSAYTLLSILNSFLLIPCRSSRHFPFCSCYRTKRQDLNFLRREGFFFWSPVSCLTYFLEKLLFMLSPFSLECFFFSFPHGKKIYSVVNFLAHITIHLDCFLSSLVVVIVLFESSHIWKHVILSLLLSRIWILSSSEMENRAKWSISRCWRKSYIWLLSRWISSSSHSMEGFDRFVTFVPVIHPHLLSNFVHDSYNSQSPCTCRLHFWEIEKKCLQHRYPTLKQLWFVNWTARQWFRHHVSLDPYVEMSPFCCYWWRGKTWSSI